MTHDEVLAADVVRLLADSQLPQRFWYLLTKHEVTPTILDNLLHVVHHLSQHSLHVAMVMSIFYLILSRKSKKSTYQSVLFVANYQLHCPLYNSDSGRA